MNDKPCRAHTAQINIEGDTWEDVVAELKSVLWNIQKDGSSSARLSAGGPSSSILRCKHYPEVTPESYLRDILQWLEEHKDE